MCQISVEEKLQKYVVYFLIVVKKKDVLLIEKLEKNAEEKHNIINYRL